MDQTIYDSPELIQGGPEQLSDANDTFNSTDVRFIQTRPEHVERTLSPEEQLEAEARKKIGAIHAVTESVATIYDKHLKELLTEHYERLNNQPLFKKIPMVIYNDFIKPPKITRAPYTKYDVTKAAADIGGQLLDGRDVHDQKFFLSIEGGIGVDESTEWVFMREGKAHIHYKIAKDSSGRLEVFKYHGSGLVHRERSQYERVRGEELENLLQAVILTRNAISREWGIFVPKTTQEQLMAEAVVADARNTTTADFNAGDYYTFRTD